MRFDPARRVKRIPCPQRGFTMIELLVVVAIMLVMTGLVVGLYNTTMNNDRIRSAARQLQSAMMGAHDRAIHAHQARGLRLILDATDQSTVTSMAYIQPIPRQSYGYPNAAHHITFEWNGGLLNKIQADAAQVAAGGFDWLDLYNLGLIYDGTRVRIPAHTGLWYTLGGTNSLVTTNPGVLYLIPPQVIKLQGGNAAPKSAFDSTGAHKSLCSIEIELGAKLVSNTPPIQLPSGIAIDLNNSRIPSAWQNYLGVAGAYSPQMDIMFSPQGNVIGSVAAQGLMNLLLAEVKDVTNPATRNPAVSVGDKLAVTLIPQSGHVYSSPVNPTDAFNNSTLPPNAGPPTGPPDSLADDPFSYARAGAIAGR